MAPTGNDWRVDLFDGGLYTSRAPNLYTMHRVLSRRLEIAQPVERGCQTAMGSYHERGVVLLFLTWQESCATRSGANQLMTRSGSGSRVGSTGLQAPFRQPADRINLIGAVGEIAFTCTLCFAHSTANTLVIPIIAALLAMYATWRSRAIMPA
jgi:hypothetical protein